MRIRMFGLLLAGLGIVPTGCSHMNNTEAGTLGGGAIGTAAGMAIGAATGNPKTGAIVGGLAGAGIGGLAGKSADNEEARAIRQVELEAAANTQLPTAPLGMTDVISLTQSGVGDSVILNQIRTTGSSYQLSAGDIQYLKSNGVSDVVLNEMISTRNRPVAVAPPNPRTVIVREPTPIVVYERPWGPPPFVMCRPPRPSFGFNYVHVHR